MMSCIGLHKLGDVIFVISQKQFYIISLVRQYMTNKGIFETCFVTWKATGH